VPKVWSILSQNKKGNVLKDGWQKPFEAFA